MVIIFVLKCFTDNLAIVFAMPAKNESIEVNPGIGIFRLGFSICA
jgi:hypothetical protein